MEGSEVDGLLLSPSGGGDVDGQVKGDRSSAPSQLSPAFIIFFYRLVRAKAPIMQRLKANGIMKINHHRAQVVK